MSMPVHIWTDMDEIPQETNHRFWTDLLFNTGAHFKDFYCFSKLLLAQAD